MAGQQRIATEGRSMTDEPNRQRMVMMGPGFGSAIGVAFMTLLWLALAGWGLIFVALVGGLIWWIFR
jgi:hypothetical protein